MRCLARYIVAFLAAVPFVPAAPPAAQARPKLVVAIVVDQFRYDYLLRFRDDYRAGLARLLDQGAVFTDAHYIHAATVTAVGHSTFLSGALPSVSGIIANEWYDRESESIVTSVSDRDSRLIGGTPGTSGSSPHRLLVSTVGDELKIRDGKGARVISISIKDRSAILPGGHMADGAFWFDPDSNQWVTSTYYMDSLPDWVKGVNALHPTRRYLGAQWFPFGAGNQSGAPFCTMVAGTDVRFCGALEATPWGNEMIEELAEAALAGERLGQHAGTDILAISFSSNDYVGHLLGPDDPAVRDMAIRTDALLGRLFERVEQSIGPGNMTVVLTADHGVAPVPEVSQARHMPGGRISDAGVTRQINQALAKRFGPGDWVVPGGVTMPYFNLKLIEKGNFDRADVERVAAQAAAASSPHIARVYTRSQILSGNLQQDAISQAISAGYYGPRSGDLIILQEPYFLFEQSGTSHGTPYEYDTHVPVIFMGRGIKAGTYRQRIVANDIAPTVAGLLGLAPPTAAAGRVLTEMMLGSPGIGESESPSR
jgi:predicted AlkP superfamily pyrophosphatase or phosphodiesterase